MRSIIVALAACLTGFAAAGCSSASGAPMTLPDVTLDRLDGSGQVSLSAIRGPAVINMWATNCAPCVREMPALQTVASEHPTVEFYGINVAEQRDAVAEFVKRLDIRYTQLLDPTGTASERLAVDSMPTTFVVGPDATVSTRHRGEITDDQLRSLLSALTAPATSGTSAP